jgi:hypothetical protein
MTSLNHLKHLKRSEYMAVASQSDIPLDQNGKYIIESDNRINATIDSRNTDISIIPPNNRMNLAESGSSKINAGRTVPDFIRIPEIGISHVKSQKSVSDPNLAIPNASRSKSGEMQKDLALDKLESKHDLEMLEIKLVRKSGSQLNESNLEGRGIIYKSKNNYKKSKISERKNNYKKSKISERKHNYKKSKISERKHKISERNHKISEMVQLNKLRRESDRPKMNTNNRRRTFKLNMEDKKKAKDRDQTRATKLLELKGLRKKKRLEKMRLKREMLEHHSNDIIFTNHLKKYEKIQSHLDLKIDETQSHLDSILFKITGRTNVIEDVSEKQKKMVTINMLTERFVQYDVTLAVSEQELAHLRELAAVLSSQLSVLDEYDNTLTDTIISGPDVIDLSNLSSDISSVLQVHQDELDSTITLHNTENALIKNDVKLLALANHLDSTEDPNDRSYIKAEMVATTNDNVKLEANVSSQNGNVTASGSSNILLYVGILVILVALGIIVVVTQK